jgi:tetratricopeptide (TPR) repeat protein
MRRSDLEKALSKFRRAIEINALHKGARLGVADCLALMGNIREALKAYEIAISIDPHAEWAQEVGEVVDRLKKRDSR